MIVILIKRHCHENLLKYKQRFSFRWLAVLEIKTYTKLNMDAFF